MTDSPKQIVKEAYNNISSWYLEWVVSDEKHASSPRQQYTEKLLQHCPPSPEILELGCGPGVPVLQYLLSRGARVVANDISEAQIGLAKQRHPQAEFVLGDMASLTFQPKRFDGVISFFTLFHLPRNDLQPFLQKVYDWLKPGGVFVFNLALFDEEEIHGEMLGHGMFWSSFDRQKNLAILEEVGFEVLEVEVKEAGNGELEEGDADFGVKFLWVAVRRP